MKQFILDMFSESSGVSNMRVLATLCVCVGLLICFIASLVYLVCVLREIDKIKDIGPASYIGITLVTLGLGAKWAQKKDENVIATEQPKV